MYSTKKKKIILFNTRIKNKKVFGKRKHLVREIISQMTGHKIENKKTVGLAPKKKKKKVVHPTSQQEGSYVCLHGLLLTDLPKLKIAF